MFKIAYDKKITMVQGDTGVIRMRISNYELSPGDEVRFAIVNKANPSILLCQHSDKKIVLEKQVTVFEKDGSARIVIYPYDTEYLQPGKYLYEIQVKTKDGRIDTVVPLTSFTLMDGSIQGEFGQTTPSKPEPTPSEIELRFKRLENEIIPELGNRITNVENDIDSISSSLDDMKNEFEQHILEKPSVDEFVLPIATKDVIGGIKVGEGLEINENGTLSVDSSPYKNNISVFERLPYNIDGLSGVNGIAFIKNNVIIKNNFMYVIFNDENRCPVIAKKDLLTNKWNKYDLKNISNNPLQAPTKNDSHNVYSMEIDNDGYIHIVGNSHDSVLKYIKSTNPYDITNWNSAVMIGSEESSITYPAFMMVGKDLLFFYRNGTSGLGNTYINIYDNTSKTWKRQCCLFDGVQSGENAYLNNISYNAKTKEINLMYCWRLNQGASSNRDMCFIKTDDLGKTWKDSNNNIKTLPLTHQTSEIACNIPENSGLINQSGFDVDDNGIPHAVVFKNDSNGFLQLIHITKVENQWITKQLTNWKNVFNTNVAVIDDTIARPSVFCIKDRTFIVYRNNFEHQGELRLMEITVNRHLRDCIFVDLDLGGYEFTYSTSILKENGILCSLICNTKQNNGANIYSSNMFLEDNWTKQYGIICSIYSKDIDLYLNGASRVPTMQLVTSNMGIQKYSFTTNKSEIPNFQLPFSLINNNNYFLKFYGRGNNTNTSMSYIFMNEKTSVGTDVIDYGENKVLLFNFGNNDTWERFTPMLPFTPNSKTSGFLLFKGQTSSGTLNLTIFNVMLYKLIL